jgi:hypothetical protein
MLIGLYMVLSTTMTMISNPRERYYHRQMAITTMTSNPRERHYHRQMALHASEYKQNILFSSWPASY